MLIRRIFLFSNYQPMKLATLDLVTIKESLFGLFTSVLRRCKINDKGGTGSKLTLANTL